MEANIKNTALNAIKANEQNPREIDKADFERLIDSLLTLPKMMQVRPIAVTGGVIYGGNMRYEALKHIALMEFAEIKDRLENLFTYNELRTQEERNALLDYWRSYLDKPVVPTIDVTGMSEAERTQFIFADNIGYGKWDYDAVANNFDAFPLNEWNLPVWETMEGEDNAVEGAESGEVQEDDFNEETDAIKVRCKQGDIWQLGEHRLMCGDSVDLEDVKRLMGGGALADLWITDPPYNVAYEGKTKDALTIKNDKMESNAFYNFLYDAFHSAGENIKSGASFYVWFASREHINFEKALVDNGFPVREELIWNKNSMVLGRQDYQWKHEPCLYGWKDGASHKWYSDRSQTTVMDFNKPNRNGEHPTMKPVELFAYQISNSSKEGDIVLDSFGGSGTTLIACEQLNRKARLMELDPHYCDVILARWEKLTGKTAVKIESI